MKCKFCGGEMHGAKPNQKYCSRKCRLTASYQRLKAKPQAPVECVICGRRFIPSPHSKNCCSFECRRVLNKRRAQERIARQRAAELATRAAGGHVKTLDDWIREAAACNLDYGTYRGLIEQGKTFDQLKAEAERKQRI